MLRNFGWFFVVMFVVCFMSGAVYAADPGTRCANGKCNLPTVSKCPNGKCNVAPPVRKRIRR